MSECALIIIDMQKFFFVENPDVDQGRLVAACRDIIQLARDARVPVIHVETVYRADGADWPAAWRKDPQSWCANLVDGRPSAAIVDGLQVEQSEIVVQKKRFSAFYNTNLDDVLRSVGARRLYLIGYSADVCLRFTSIDAYNRGYDVSLIEEGIESFKETKEQSLSYLQWLIDADAANIESFAQAIATGAGVRG